MTLPSKIAGVGFILSIMGFVIAAVFEQRIFGRTLFILGFYIMVTGVVVGIIFLPLEGAFAKFRIGVRICAIGLGISSLSFLVSSLSGKEELGGIVFYVGFAIVIVGIFTLILGILRGGLDQ